MSSRGVRFAFAVLALAGSAPPARADGSPPREGTAPAAEVDDATAERRRLLVARFGAMEPEAAERTARELAASSSWPDLFAVYVEVMEDFRCPYRAEAVLEALARSGRAKLHELLAAAAAKDADPLLRTVALRVAGHGSSEAALADVVALARSFPAEQRSSHLLLVPLGAAVGVAVERRPEEAEVLRSEWKSFDARLRTTFLDALAASRRPGAARALSRLLDTGAPGDGEILLRLARMPIHGAEPFDPATESFARGALTASDRNLRAGAAAFCGRIAGPDLAEPLFEMLGDEDARVAVAAHRALEAATGSALASDRELWRQRLDAERAWAEKDLAAGLKATRGSVTAVVVSAILRLSDHRLHGAAVAPPLEGFVRHGAAPVRLAACTALGRLGQPSSIRALLAAVEDADPEVASAASRSLAAVTLLPSPSEPTGWRKVLDADAR